MREKRIANERIMMREIHKDSDSYIRMQMKNKREEAKWKIGWRQDLLSKLLSSPAFCPGYKTSLRHPLGGIFNITQRWQKNERIPLPLLLSLSLSFPLQRNTSLCLLHNHKWTIIMFWPLWATKRFTTCMPMSNTLLLKSTNGVEGEKKGHSAEEAGPMQVN